MRWMLGWAAYLVVIIGACGIWVSQSSTLPQIDGPVEQKVRSRVSSPALTPSRLAHPYLHHGVNFTMLPR